MKQNINFISSAFCSLLLGLYLLFQFDLNSGMAPFLCDLLLGLILIITVLNLLLIFEQKNLNLKRFQIIIILLAILLKFHVYFN